MCVHSHCNCIFIYNVHKLLYKYYFCALDILPPLFLLVCIASESPTAEIFLVQTLLWAFFFFLLIYLGLLFEKNQRVIMPHWFIYYFSLLLLTICCSILFSDLLVLFLRSSLIYSISLHVHICIVSTVYISRMDNKCNKCKFKYAL